MIEITPRSPLIDWNKGFEKCWNGNPSATHVFNVLSFLFPQGERFFIKVIREVSKKHSQSLTPELQKDIRGFLHQEATHTKHHQLYNNNLEKQGYVNVAYGYVDCLERMAHKYYSPVQKLAFVCAYEHYTAILGNYILKSPDVLAAAPKEMSLMWQWHAAEEVEHKAVSFDLYKSVGGSWLRRVLVFLFVSLDFLVVFSRLYLNMLWRDGALNIKVLHKTLFQSTAFFWGRKGVGWHLLFHGVKYFSPSFHPWNQDNKALIKQWLMKNNNFFKNSEGVD